MNIRQAFDYLLQARLEGLGEEPVFVLRGRDVLAPVAVQAWIGQAESLNKCAQHMNGENVIDLEKIEQAKMTLLLFDQWEFKRVPVGIRCTNAGT